MNHWYTAVLLILAAALSYWLLQRMDESGPPTSARPQTPDYYMDGMIRKTMDPGGGIKHVINAERIEHFPHDDSTELVSPHVELYNGGERPWQIRAQRGWVSQGNEEIMLYGKVEIWRLNSRGQKQLEVVTTDLRVVPDEQFAESDNPVTIRTPDSTTTAIGIRANLAHSRLELLQQVKSHYDKTR